ncbi:vanillate/3-O-methylgallate O-demethylase [Thermorudis peleae]|uniref:vanillate/3-O-methylgallate O-demethylase n=1 Tax=Thermorudis peleae TaxID=1382356 RepID=UPI00057017B3|nr:aminomethyltransferase family protein [Thermorudis peleae]
MTGEKPRTLQDIVSSVPNIVDYLYNNQTGARVYPVVRPEYSNWRDEQHAWRETVCLFDLSYHMTDLYVSGPDAFRLLEHLAINSFRGFEPGMAKQMVGCTPAGYVIGDGILFYLEPERFQLVGRPSLHNWVQYHAETGGYNVTVERDEWSVTDPNRPRKVYRYQLQGPAAGMLLEKLHGGPLPEVPFFHMTWLTIAGHRVRLLHHGMSGVAGGELFGPFEEGPAVKEAILKAGEEFGIRHVGSRAYATNTLESGWIPSPLPAVYTGEDLRGYREWLPATSYEATGSLGGSFVAPHIEDYYLDPWELGYGRLLKFDHDFIGREALQAKATEPHRKKVTLAWNGEDVARAFATLFTKPKGERAKYIDLPLSQYATWMYDQVRSQHGEVIGISTFCGYSSNEGKMLSLAMLDPAYAEPGTEVILVWGEPNGGSRKPSVEQHVQVELRATVGPVPYSAAAREYRGKVVRH